MERSLLFFESKSKKGDRKIHNNSNHSRSQSSKLQIPTNSARTKQIIIKHALSKKQRQIREAIEYRYARSKIKEFKITQNTFISTKNKNFSVSSLSSSQMKQYNHLKNQKYINLKDYHKKHRENSVQSNNKSSIRFKVRQSASKTIKTQGNDHSKQKNKYYNFLNRNKSNNLTKKQEWKFISIQLKNQEKSKTKKTQLKINSHRTLNFQKNPSKGKIKSNQKKLNLIYKSSKTKQFQKMAKKYKF